MSYKVLEKKTSETLHVVLYWWVHCNDGHNLLNSDQGTQTKELRSRNVKGCQSSHWDTNCCSWLHAMILGNKRIQEVRNRLVLVYWSLYTIHLVLKNTVLLLQGVHNHKLGRIQLASDRTWVALQIRMHPKCGCIIIEEI